MVVITRWSYSGVPLYCQFIPYLVNFQYFFQLSVIVLVVIMVVIAFVHGRVNVDLDGKANYVKLVNKKKHLDLFTV